MNYTVLDCLFMPFLIPGWGHLSLQGIARFQVYSHISRDMQVYAMINLPFRQVLELYSPFYKECNIGLLHCTAVTTNWLFKKKKVPLSLDQLNSVISPV